MKRRKERKKLERETEREERSAKEIGPETSSEKERKLSSEWEARAYYRQDPAYRYPLVSVGIQSRSDAEGQK